jgi:hypothetical protein
MRKLTGFFMVLFGALLTMAAMERHTVGWGVLSDRYSSSYAGDLYVVTPSGEQPYLTIYDAANSEWDTIFQSDTFTTDVTFQGDIVRQVYRQDFDCGPIKVEEDFTAAVETDAAMLRAIFPCVDAPLTFFHYRLDEAQTDPFIVNTEGKLDVDNDGIDNEGVDIVIGVDDPQTVMTPWVYGTEWYFRIGFDIESISGTDTLHTGWRINGDYVDEVVVETQDTYGAWYWNSTAGNAVMATGDDTVDATDEVTGADLSENEYIVVEVRIEADGTFSFLYAASETAIESASEQTQVNTLNAAIAEGDVMMPYFAFISAADADTNLMIDFVEVGIVN